MKFSEILMEAVHNLSEVAKEEGVDESNLDDFIETLGEYFRKDHFDWLKTLKEIEEQALLDEVIRWINYDLDHFTLIGDRPEIGHFNAVIHNQRNIEIYARVIMNSLNRNLATDELYTCVNEKLNSEVSTKEIIEVLWYFKQVYYAVLSWEKGTVYYDFYSAPSDGDLEWDTLQNSIRIIANDFGG